MTASHALRAASAPIPPHTSTARPFSKNLKFRPSYSRSLIRQRLTSGQTSRSSAATIATLIVGIAIILKPLNRAAKRIVSVEENYSGQLAQLVQEHTGVMIRERANKFDGRPFSEDEMVRALSRVYDGAKAEPVVTHVR